MWVAFAYAHSDWDSHSHSNCDSDGNSYTHAHGDSNTDAVRRKVYADAAAASHSTASAIGELRVYTADSLAMRLTRLTETRLQGHSLEQRSVVTGA